MSCCISDIGVCNEGPLFGDDQGQILRYAYRKQESMEERGRTVRKSGSNKGLWIKGGLFIQLHTYCTDCNIINFYSESCF